MSRREPAFRQDPKPLFRQCVVLPGSLSDLQREQNASQSTCLLRNGSCLVNIDLCLKTCDSILQCNPETANCFLWMGSERPQGWRVPGPGCHTGSYGFVSERELLTKKRRRIPLPAVFGRSCFRFRFRFPEGF